jgi:hypothetical protein
MQKVERIAIEKPKSTNGSRLKASAHFGKRLRPMRIMARRQHGPIAIRLQRDRDNRMRRGLFAWIYAVFIDGRRGINFRYVSFIFPWRWCAGSAAISPS